MPVPLESFIFPDPLLTQTPDQRQLQADLPRVYYLIAAGVPPAPEERLQTGSPVEITGEPLAELEGKVLPHGKQLKSDVQVPFLRQGLSVEIESWIQPWSGLASLATARA